MSRHDDEGTIDLRRKQDSETDDVEFKINSMDEAEHDKELIGKVSPVTDNEFSEMEKNIHSKIKVKFDKFVSLIATHAYEEIFEKYREEDIIIGTDLLTDLANAHEEKSDKKVPLMFLGGIVLGGILMWILLKT